MVSKAAHSLPLLGELPVDWQAVEFGSVLLNGTRNGLYKPKEFHGSGIKMVNMGEIFAHPRLRSVPMRRVQVSGDELERFGLKMDDLLFARRSLVAEGAGKCCLVLQMDEPATFESSIIRARPDPNKVDSHYLFYLFMSPFGEYALGTILRHVAVAGITGSDLVKLRIPLPPLTEQRAIAQVLSKLDDKIELNRRMNETLEGMARAIFKSWFVDFDPVRAKAEGREPFGMDAETAALFPDSFQDSLLGKIPKGWRICPVGDVVEVGGGSTPSTKEPTYWDGQINWATPKDLSTLHSPVLLATERRITPAGLEAIGSRVYPEGTLLLSSRAPIGYLAISEIPVSVNQGMIAMVCAGNPSNQFMLQWTHENMDVIEGRASGTTFQEISKSSFRSIPITLPSDPVMTAFTETVEPFHHFLVNNLRESQTLTTIRDALLPGLISGEIRVAGVERTSAS